MGVSQLGELSMMNHLWFVPKNEVERSLDATQDPILRSTLFATLCRINTLYMISVAGSGHIGSSFSCLDIVSWLYLNELRRADDGTPHDIFFSSKGHDVPALYSVLIGLGMLPFDKLQTLRRLEGLPGHPDVSIANIAANSGSLGMGISKAKGMIRANRLDKRDPRIFVMTGDGELQEGQIWESLQGAANAKMHELTVIVDHNKIQSDYWIADTSELGNLEQRFASFGWQVLRCGGHDLGQLTASFDDRHQDPRPGVIIADTVKGRGVEFMEPTNLGYLEPYRYHSGAPTTEEYEQALAELVADANQQLEVVGATPLKPQSRSWTKPAQTQATEQLIPAYGEALVAAGQRNDSLIALDADLSLDCGLSPFRSVFPGRYVECGIAEMDMVSQAGGMALAGKLPVVHSFASFLTPRANEQIYNNATEGTKIIYVGCLAGLIPGGPGHSHQSVRDIALMSCIPGLHAFEPASASETKAALNWMVEQTTGPSYLRLTSVPVPLSFKPFSTVLIEPGKGTTIRAGNSAVIFAYGPIMVSEAIKAANRLDEGGSLSARVINLPWLNHIDLDWLRAEMAEIDYVFTIDNHYISGGQGEKIFSAITRLGLKKIPKVRCFGLRTVPACGTNEEVLRHHRLDASSIASEIKLCLRS